MDFLTPVIEGSRLQFPIGIELIIILIIVALLLFLGPTKLPQLARGIGKALGEFRRGRMEIDREIRKEIATAETYTGDGTQQVVEISPRLVEAAKELNIDVLGRKERDLKMEIIKALDRQSEKKLRKIAGLLGVTSEGLDQAQLKDQIGEALGV